MTCHISKHGRCLILAYVLLCFHYQKIGAVHPRRLRIKEVRDSVKKFVHFVGDLADDKPHTAYDFRVMIDQDKAECFMQEVESSTKLIFNFQALSPPTFTSDRKISAFLYILEDDTMVNETNNVRRVISRCLQTNRQHTGSVLSTHSQMVLYSNILGYISIRRCECIPQNCAK
ncbi:uncharacterized protein LOC120330260 [Styela clava]